MTIGEMIKNRRIELNMTQLDLAETVGTTTATISRWESGDIHKMKRSNMTAIAKALRMDPVILTQREEVIFPDEAQVLDAYRAADDGTKAAVRKLLDLPEAKKDASGVAI